MDKESSSKIQEQLPEFLSGGGEMGERIRSFDWSETSLGPVHAWPQSLRTCIRIMLTSRQPIWIGWGKELIKFYNDPYKAIVGGKHPWALGTPASIVWKDIWHDIEPMLKTVMEEGEGTYVESQLLIMERNGYPEETYYTFSYTPIPGDDGKIAGMFCANTDDTVKIISERQLQTLTALGRRMADCKNTDEVFKSTIETLQDNPLDFPFALFRNVSGNISELTYCTDFGEYRNKIFTSIDLSTDTILARSLRTVIDTGKPVQLTDMLRNFGTLPSGGWPVSPDKAMIIPIFHGPASSQLSLLSIGVNPYRVLDEQYLSFLQLVADQVASALAGMQALETERKKAESLAEIDKAKTMFFSNISHEFRTPLTLMLGSLEQLMGKQALKFSKEGLSSLDTMNRNAMRLLRLVNNLLDFSRIEAGRARAHFQITDLAKFTADVASTFRSVIEKAGLKLIVNCDEFIQPVYVDREMWEKIVLNLLSNAYKYTLQGEISVSLKAQDSRIILSIKDTGVGIPEEELPRMFERFHRVENTAGRSFEGTGIGLSLVSELIKMHQGEISVKSEVGKGSEFIVEIHAGKSHLPSDQIIEREDQQQQSENFFTDETQVYNEPEEIDKTVSVPEKNQASVLVVDDNPDMREYFRRLLEPHYNVSTAVNGMEALQKIKVTRPDLVVSDIMMPVLDGIQMVTAIKNNPVTSNLPVILVSARAGEEARIEGYDTGADDYLVKPFSAKELLARVRTQLKINQAREHALQSIYKSFDDLPFSVAVLRGPDLVIDYINRYNLNIWQKQKENVVGKPLPDIFPGKREQMLKLHEGIYTSGKRFNKREIPVELNFNGKIETRYYDAVIDPLFNENGKVVGQLACSIDVTEQVLARKKIEASESLFRNILLQAPDPILILSGPDLILEVANEPLFRIWNVDESAIGKTFLEILPEMKGQPYLTMLQDVYHNHKIIKGEESPAVFVEADGSERTVYFNFIYQPYRGLQGEVTGVLVLATDVTPQVMARKKLEESEQRFRLLAQSIPQIVWTTDPTGRTDFISQQWETYTGQPLELALSENERMIHPDDQEKLRKIWKDSIAGGVSWKMDYRLYDVRAASYRWYNGLVKPLKDKENVIYRWVGTATDIHEQKQFSEELERLVQLRTIELKRSNEDLQQFAHVASHDLKEPVRKIKTFANRLQVEYQKDLPEKAAMFVEKVHHAADRMGAMIEGVLNYSKVGTEKMRFEKVDLAHLIEQVEQDLEIPIQQKNAKINVYAIGTVEGVPILLYQLFYNLLTNSLKFSRTDRDPVINITSFEENLNSAPCKRIVISDNGIGFEPEYREKIFETFTRLHSKDTYEGTGLGLALCKKIVERHGGIISADSHGDGAVFEIWLPYSHNIS